MRQSIGVLALACFVAFPSFAAAQEGAPQGYDFTVLGGWSWPASGDFSDGWNSGFTLAGAIGRSEHPHLHHAIEVGYGWYGLDAGYFKSLAPTLDISGGDAGIFVVTGQTDLLFGAPERHRRPFLNLGLGVYNISVSDVTVRGGGYGSFEPNALDSTGFGVHIGGGFLAERRRVSVRVDAAYHHVFLSGSDVGYVPVRLGIVFRPI